MGSLHKARGNGNKLHWERFHLDIRKKVVMEALTAHGNSLPGDIAEGFQEGIDRVLVSSMLFFPQKVGQGFFSPGQFCDSTGFYFCLKIQLIARHCFHEI